MKSVCFYPVYLLSFISYQKKYIYINTINVLSFVFLCVNGIASEVCVMFDIAMSLENHYSNKMLNLLLPLRHVVI